VVIGVVDNFHFQSLRLKIEPLVITLGQSPRIISVKIGAKEIPATLNFMENTYKKFSGGYSFDFSFLDDRLDNLYRTDYRLGQIFTFFTGIAILIACLGLFGLGSFTAAKRTKEIGIRKVLGASVSRILFMLSKDFLRLVFVAAFIGIPLSWYLMNRWLDNFAYRISIEAELFLFAFILALFISFISIGYKSYRAAVTHPINCLRDE
jgi:putative ABC transport system permease protein